MKKYITMLVEVLQEPIAVWDDYHKLFRVRDKNSGLVTNCMIPIKFIHDVRCGDILHIEGELREDNFNYLLIAHKAQLLTPFIESDDFTLRGAL